MPALFFLYKFTLSDIFVCQLESMKKTIVWIIAVLITFFVVVFQLMMNSTYPLSIEVNTGKQLIQAELRRSYSGKSDCPVILTVRDIMVSGYMLYRIFPSDNSMSRIDFRREGDKLIARLPRQPLSGKLQYLVILERDKKVLDLNNGNPVVITYLGKVPLYLLVMHSLVILLTVLYSTLTGLYAGFGIISWKRMTFLVIVLLLGIVFFLQPLMHKYSLNQWWTCIPKSWELGDNKLLLSLMVWLVAAYYTVKKGWSALIILASFTSVFLFSVPHGFPGKEQNPATLEILMKNLLPLIQLF